jgi:hypothetical protein
LKQPFCDFRQRAGIIRQITNFLTGNPVCLSPSSSLFSSTLHLSLCAPRQRCPHYRFWWPVASSATTVQQQSTARSSPRILHRRDAILPLATAPPASAGLLPPAKMRLPGRSNRRPPPTWRPMPTARGRRGIWNSGRAREQGGARFPTAQREMLHGAWNGRRWRWGTDAPGMMAASCRNNGDGVRLGSR